MTKHSHSWFKKDTLVQTIVVLAFLIFVIAEISTLIRDYNDTRGDGILKSHTQQQTHMQIQSWMTFSYLNIFYDLPTNYLKDALGISDIRYPNVEIRHYAKEHSVDQAALITEITETVGRVRP